MSTNGTDTHHKKLQQEQINSLPVEGAVVCFVFAFLAISLSIHLIYAHLSNFSKPILQKRIVRILLMAPIYSLFSLLTYIYPDYELTYDLLRSCYESFVIYEFFALLQQYLGESEQERQRVLAPKPPAKLIFPLCCFKYYPSSTYFLNDLRILVMQYIVIRPLTTVIALILASRGKAVLDKGIIFVNLINFFATGLAMYGLILFYWTIKKDIYEFKPVNKFLSVKFVIFMTFWQSMIIGAFAKFGLIPNATYWNEEYVGVRIQAVCICVEMFIASIWHKRDNCFGVTDFLVESKTSVSSSLKVCFDPTETLLELFTTIKHVFDRIYSIILGRKMVPVKTGPAESEAIITEDVLDSPSPNSV